MKRTLRSVTVALTAALAASAGGCIEPIEVATDDEAQPLQVGQSRRVELRFRRLDVEGFRETLTLEDLRALPRAILDDVWLLDLPLKQFSYNALEQLASLTPQQAFQEPVPVRNMVTLLNLTPDNVELAGTRLEELVQLSTAIGQPAPRALARILQIGVTDRIIPLDVASDVMVSGLIASHPAGQTRSGPVTPEHPDGRYAVTPGALPVTLGDVVDNFERLTERFGPATLPDGTEHPGFIVDAQGFSVIEEAFNMTVKVNANALPYKGLDLTDLSVDNVGSLGSQIDTLFATDDPDWLRIEGLVELPTIQTVTVRVTEHPTFVPAGDQRDPTPDGNAPVWDLPPWRFERLVAEMARETTEAVVPDCTVFTVGANTEVFRVCTDALGWTTFQTFNNVGNPPPPVYLWDLQHEMAQVRLHDGGLAEGEGIVEFTIRNIDLGVTSTTVVAETRRNLEEQPRLLRAFVNAVADSTDGAADVFYYRSQDGRDWLWFIDKSDVPRTADGGYERSVDYPAAGFFADAALTQKVSSTQDVEGDTLHEKVELTNGRTLFTADAEGGVFSMKLVAKPSRNRIELEVQRIR
jgi:hypothetical protein